MFPVSSGQLTACQVASQPLILWDTGEDGQPRKKTDIAREGEWRGGRVKMGKRIGERVAMGVKGRSETWLSFCHLVRVRDIEFKLWLSDSRVSHVRAHTRAHKCKKKCVHLCSHLSLFDLFSISLKIQKHHFRPSCLFLSLQLALPLPASGHE